MPDQFDVFLCHNSQDKPEVIEIAQQLQQRGLKPWLDVWELRPGLSWQAQLGKQIENIKSAAVFVGRSGFGPWQIQEIDAFLRRFVNQGCPVIPVLLADAPKQPDLPIFLDGMMWVDFRQSEPDPMEQLIWGITGIKPEAPITPSFPSLQVFEFDVVTLNTQGQEIKRSRRQNFYFEENLGNEIVLEMVLIPGGTFQMGSPEGEGYAMEKPQHQVEVQPFFMGKYPVTQAQWRAIASLPKVERDLEPDPSYFKGDNRPVEVISWYDAVEFCERLSRETRREYRLPSEAEWEYACRAGTTTPFHFGPKITREVFNCKRNLGMALIQVVPELGFIYPTRVSGLFLEMLEYYTSILPLLGIGETTEVGSFKVANAFGLYDMHGNVWEWCADAWHDNYENAPTDGSAWIEEGNDNFSPLRGGSWFNFPVNCRSASRFNNFWLRVNIFNSFGFRVVCGVGRTQ